MSSDKTFFSISDISRLSGVKTHTLRVWESRYGLIIPERSCNNIRMYSDEHLHRIMEIIELKNNGHKLSEIALLSNSDFKKEIEKCHDLDCHNISETVQLLIKDLITFQDLAFNEKLNQLLERSSIRSVIKKVILKIIDQIDVLMITGTIDEIQRNFFKSTLNRFLIKLISAVTDDPEYYTTNIKVGHIAIGENFIDLEYNLGRYVLLSYHNKLYSIGEVGSISEAEKHLPMEDIDYLYIMIRGEDEYFTTKGQLELFKKRYPQVGIIITILGNNDIVESQYELCNSFSALELLFKKLTNKNL